MVIGLTGGIGAGKSTVANILKEHGMTVLDADLISREVTQKDAPLLRLLVQSFGIEIIKDDGNLDRKLLAELAFSDMDKTRRLNELVQTAILIRAIEKVHHIRLSGDEGVIFFDVPLLFEAGWDSFVQQVWLVTAPEDVRIERIKARDGLSEQSISARMKLQMPEAQKEELSDVIFVNDGGEDQLRENVESVIAERFPWLQS